MAQTLTGGSVVRLGAAEQARATSGAAWRRLGLERFISGGVLVLVAVLVLLPLLFLGYAAFRTGVPGQRDTSLTLEYLRTVYLTTKYLPALLNIVVLAGTVAILVLPIGTLFAWLVGCTDLPGKRLLELLIIVPIFISPLLGTLAWLGLAAPGAGFINAIATLVFGQKGDLVNIYSVPGMVFVMFLYYVPYVYLFMIGAFRNLDPALEEAARMSGCGPLAALRRVVLPLVFPALVSSALLIFVLGAELFSVPALPGVKSHFDTIPLLLYMGFEYNYAPGGEVASLATLLLWITVTGVLVYRRMMALSRRYVTISGKGRRSRLTSLGRWKYLALSLIGSYIFVAVVLAYLSLVLGSLLKFVTPRITAETLTLANYAALTQPDKMLALGNTLFLAVVGATVTVLLAFIVAHRTVRVRSVATTAIDYIASLPVAVPGLALALGILWAYANLPFPIYGTLLMLLIAYVTRFISYSVRVASGSLHQIDPELEEAGRIAGLSNFGTFWRISFPLLRSSVLSSWTLVFIFVVVEVTSTILLYTPDTRTISMVMWNAFEMSGSVGGFAIGVLQITMIFIILAITYRLAGRVNVGVE